MQRRSFLSSDRIQPTRTEETTRDILSTIMLRVLEIQHEFLGVTHS